MQNITTNTDSNRTVVIASSKSHHNDTLEEYFNRQNKFVVRRTDEAAVLWSWIERGLGDCIITDPKLFDENIIDFFNLVKKFYGINHPGII